MRTPKAAVARIAALVAAVATRAARGAKVDILWDKVEYEGEGCAGAVVEKRAGSFNLLDVCLEEGYIGSTRTTFNGTHISFEFFIERGCVGEPVLINFEVDTTCSGKARHYLLEEGVDTNQTMSSFVSSFNSTEISLEEVCRKIEGLDKMQLGSVPGVQVGEFGMEAVGVCVSVRSISFLPLGGGKVQAFDAPGCAGPSVETSCFVLGNDDPERIAAASFSSVEQLLNLKETSAVELANTVDVYWDNVEYAGEGCTGKFTKKRSELLGLLNICMPAAQSSLSAIYTFDPSTSTLSRAEYANPTCSGFHRARPSFAHNTACTGRSRGALVETDVDVEDIVILYVASLDLSETSASAACDALPGRSMSTIAQVAGVRAREFSLNAAGTCENIGDLSVLPVAGGKMNKFSQRDCQGSFVETPCVVLGSDELLVSGALLAFLGKETRGSEQPSSAASTACVGLLMAAVVASATSEG